MRRAVVLPLSLAACATGSSAPGLDIRLQALSLPGVTDATYDITVADDAGDVTWSATVSSRQYGDGSGSVTYVGTCDATDHDGDGKATATVSLKVVSLEGIDPDAWVNPTADGPLVLVVPCVANADTPVVFDLVFLRVGEAGFLDVSVDASQITCNAKLDCVDDSGLPLELLDDPQTGVRAPTAVMALACTAGDKTVLHLDTVKIGCADGTSYAIDLATLGQGPAQPPLIVATQTSTGVGGGGLVSWTGLVGLDASVVEGGGTNLGCRLSGAGTASDGPWPNGAPPAGSAWPYVTFDVPLTDEKGLLACSQHPLGGGNGVEVAYRTGR